MILHDDAGGGGGDGDVSVGVGAGARMNAGVGAGRSNGVTAAAAAASTVVRGFPSLKVLEIARSTGFDPLIAAQMLPVCTQLEELDMSVSEVPKIQHTHTHTHTGTPT